MRPGRRKLAKIASSATNLPAVAVVVAGAVIKTPAVAVVVTFVAIDSLEP
jgi:hypothetical protein